MNDVQREILSLLVENKGSVSSREIRKRVGRGVNIAANVREIGTQGLKINLDYVYSCEPAELLEFVKNKKPFKS